MKSNIVLIGLAAALLLHVALMAAIYSRIKPEETQRGVYRAIPAYQGHVSKPRPVRP